MTGEGTEALGGKRPPDSWGTGGSAEAQGHLCVRCPRRWVCALSPLPSLGLWGRGPAQCLAMEGARKHKFPHSLRP